MLLRQNPHNVAEWQKRVDLLEGRPREVVSTFTEAVQTIEPKQAVGKLASLWVNFAKFYENNKQIEDARIIFEKATHVAYLKVSKYSRRNHPTKFQIFPQIVSDFSGGKCFFGGENVFLSIFVSRR